MQEQIRLEDISAKTEAEIQNARENLLLREEYLRNVPVVSIREYGTAHDLIQEGRIFGIGLNSEIQFLPAFQFDEELLPKPAITTVLDRLYEAGQRGWEIALWFDTELEMLDGKKPSEALDEDPDAVIAAAAAEMDIPQ